jgi:hypothetical protein
MATIKAAIKSIVMKDSVCLHAFDAVYTAYLKGDSPSEQNKGIQALLSFPVEVNSVSAVSFQFLMPFLTDGYCLFLLNLCIQ